MQKYAQLELERRYKPVLNGFGSWFTSDEYRSAQIIVTVRFLLSQIVRVDKAVKNGNYENRSEFIRSAVLDLFCYPNEDSSFLTIKKWNGYRCFKARQLKSGSFKINSLRFLPEQLQLIDEKVIEDNYDSRTHLIRTAVMQLVNSYEGGEKMGKQHLTKAERKERDKRRFRKGERWTGNKIKQKNRK